MEKNTFKEATLSLHSGTPNIDHSILIVDDDPNVIQLMGRILLDLGKLRFATNAKDALRLVRESAPDLILLDAEMPGISGFQLFETLKTEPELADVPVIFVTSHSEAGFEISALEMGAADFIAKPFRSSLVLARVKTHLRVRHMTHELRRTATTDSLTGVANGRQFDQLLEREWQRGQRGGDPMSLLLIDMDDFKLYNDRYGRPKGNACLVRLAETLTSSCQRPADFLARCAGGEFMALLPQTPRRGAEHVAHRILDAVEALGIFHEDSPTARHVTVSVGIACYDNASASWETPGAHHRASDDMHIRCAASELVLTADKALSAAKRAGGAQVRLLDITNVDMPEQACAVTPLSRAAHRPTA